MMGSDIVSSLVSRAGSAPSGGYGSMRLRSAGSPGSPDVASYEHRSPSGACHRVFIATCGVTPRSRQSATSRALRTTRRNSFRDTFALISRSRFLVNVE